MRILHLLAPAPAGGLERVVQGLAIGQRRRNHDVCVVPVVESWHEDLPFAQPLMRGDVGILPIQVNSRDYFEERRRLRDILSTHTPDVVHSHGYHTNVIGRAVVMKAHVPFVATAHGFTGGSLRNRLYEWLDCHALARSDAAIAVSRPLADELARRGVPRTKVHTVPNGWLKSSEPLDRYSARQALGLPETGTIVGWVGRMTHEKGLDVFIEAMALTPSHALACIVGAGIERESAERRAAELGIANRIHWAGLVSEAGRYFRAFDILCQSSRTEGVPMTILEAMAVGVPIVATAVGGVPDVLSTREAMLVTSEDVRALASAIEESMADVSAASLRVAEASARLEHQFSGDAWLDEHERVYRLATENASRRR